MKKRIRMSLVVCIITIFAMVSRIQAEELSSDSLAKTPPNGLELVE